MPECEQRLWQHLRAKRLDGFKFRRQYVIAPYIVDFASIAGRLVVEIDGETHGNDRRERLDALRTAYLERSGWRVIRFWTDELRDMDYVVDTIRQALRAEPVP